jgi:hypothetical protein
MTATEELQLEITKLQEEFELIRQLGRSNGFYMYYFSKLKDFKTNIDCFHHVNDLYYKYFNEYRYSSYNSFRTITNKYLKNER